jgi:hypothetical protein
MGYRVRVAEPAAVSWPPSGQCARAAGYRTRNTGSSFQPSAFRAAASSSSASSPYPTSRSARAAPSRVLVRTKIWPADRFLSDNSGGASGARTARNCAELLGSVPCARYFKSRPPRRETPCFAGGFCFYPSSRTKNFAIPGALSAPEPSWKYGRDGQRDGRLHAGPGRLASCLTDVARIWPGAVSS